MKNRELNNINNALSELLSMPMQGLIKFKIAKLLHEVDREMVPFLSSIEGIDRNSLEFAEIMEAEIGNAISVTLSQLELEPLNISPRTLILLEPVLESVEEN